MNPILTDRLQAALHDGSAFASGLVVVPPIGGRLGHAKLNYDGMRMVQGPTGVRIEFLWLGVAVAYIQTSAALCASGDSIELHKLTGHTPLRFS
jgi:hypothetical protein